MTGEVKQELHLTAADWNALPRTKVTAKGEHDPQPRVYEGVALKDLLAKAGVPSGMEMHGKGMTLGVVRRRLRQLSRALFSRRTGREFRKRHDFGSRSRGWPAVRSERRPIAADCGGRQTRRAMGAHAEESYSRASRAREIIARGRLLRRWRWRWRRSISARGRGRRARR